MSDWHHTWHLCCWARVLQPWIVALALIDVEQQIDITQAKVAKDNSIMNGY